jgi:mRNA interferase MazF
MMNLGDIYWVNLEPTKGAEIKKMRPCVIVSATPINRARHTVVVVPLSTSARENPPLVIAVKCLNKSVTAICDQIRAVDKSRLVKPAGQLDTEDLASLKHSLRQVLSI